MILARGGTILNMKTTFSARLNPVLVMLLSSCGSQGMNAHGIGSGGVGGVGGTNSLLIQGGGSGATTQPGPRGGAGGTGGTITSTVRGGSGGQSTVCAKIECNADFPCYYNGYDKPKCVVGDPNSAAIGEDVGCEEVCGTPCCSGSSCKTTTSPCPTGTVCAYPNANSTAECVSTSRACGGFLGNTCASTEYCEYFGEPCADGSSSCRTGLPGACLYVNSGATGVCHALPSESACSSFTQPICGCDGVTYKNDCARRAASAAYAHSGACSGGSVAGGTSGTSGTGAGGSTTTGTGRRNTGGTAAGGSGGSGTGGVVGSGGLGAGGALATGGSSGGDAGAVTTCSCAGGKTTLECFCRVFSCDRTLASFTVDAGTSSAFSTLEEYADCDLVVVTVMNSIAPWVYVFNRSTGQLVGEQYNTDAAEPCRFGGDSGAYYSLSGGLFPDATCVRSRCTMGSLPGLKSCPDAGS
jgi:hypothetical protein